MQKQNLDIIDKLDGEEGFVELVMVNLSESFGMKTKTDGTP